VAPKQDLLEGIENIKETQMRIAQINAQAQLMQQRAQQFLMEDPDGQASQIAEAQRLMQNQMPMEAEVMAEEEALPEPEE
jgi:putative heme iron utilization protein